MKYIIAFILSIITLIAPISAKAPTDQELADAKQRQVYAHTMAQAARGLGYEETHEVILLAKEEWLNAQDIVIKARHFKEYPVAAEIWYFMKDLGWNDYICAGVLGNIMAEAAVCDFNIQINAYNGTNYGICQWNKVYYPEVQWTNLDTQLTFLANTIKYEINTFGRVYQIDFKCEDFLLLEDEREAALAFAKAYERCSAYTYKYRQDNAEVALAYFGTSR